MPPTEAKFQIGVTANLQATYSEFAASLQMGENATDF